MASSANGGRPFPEDLTEEILLMLPVKSLLRFECACKKWYKVIKNPGFIKQHLNKNCDKPPQILVYDHCAADDDSPPITLISDGGVLETCFQGLRGITYLLGSVDGLFLLERVIDGNVYNISLSLWNPATRELRLLPEPNFDLQPCLRQFTCEFGFGSDLVTNDYKVVWFRSFEDDTIRPSVERAYAAVYSCSKDSWRILQLEENDETLICNRYFREPLGTAYLNGAYYWLRVVEGFGKCSIVSFDFSNEVFGLIEGPDAERPFNHYHLFLILLDDSLGLMSEVSMFRYETWVLIQPRLWNKLYTFQCFTSSSHIKCWINPSTVIFVTNRSRLVSYDIRTGESQRLGFRHRGLRRAFWRISIYGCSVHIYKKSLVTIKRGKEVLDP